MSDLEIARNLATTIREEFDKMDVAIENIYLFGSRARGDAVTDSDWDFLVITKDEIDRSLKQRVASSIRVRLAFEKNIAADFVIHPANMLQDILAQPSFVAHQGIREGVLV